MKAIIGKKVGMTQIFDENGYVIPVTVIRSPHKHKDSREQFEMRTHKRVIDILYPTQKTMDSLMKLELPAGVDIEIKN